MAGRLGVGTLNVLRLVGDQTVGKASRRAKRYETLFSGDGGLADFFGSGNKGRSSSEGRGVFDRHGETW